MGVIASLLAIIRQSNERRIEATDGRLWIAANVSAEF